jgi:hypothetical protein
MVFAAIQYRRLDLRDCFETIAKADRSTHNQWLPLPPGSTVGLRIEQGQRQESKSIETEDSCR